MTTRDDILPRLAAIAADLALFPADVPIDEPEPSAWVPLEPDPDTGLRLQHAAAVQDGPPADETGRLSGAANAAVHELELDVAVVYAVQALSGSSLTTTQLRTARRLRRRQAVNAFVAAVQADPTLGLGAEVFAEVRPVETFDDVAFENGVPTATAVIPVQVLYTSASPAG
jgi:hypothetical protein